jgi:restriction system protein
MRQRTVSEAAIEALKQSGKPLSARSIYLFIVEKDLYRFNAENPENIVRISIRRHCEGVDFPSAKPNKYFKILLDGTYWIKDIPIPGQTPVSIKSENIVKKDSLNLKSILVELQSIHSKHLIAFKKQLLAQLKEIPPKTFETFAKKLLEVYGFQETKVTIYTKDGGLDGYGKLKVGITYLNVAFQCKRWKTTSVSRTEIDKFRGATQGMYEQGIIFTTSNFSKGAQNATRRNGAVPIILIDGSTLIDIMIEKKFGVTTENIPVYINSLEDIFTDE